MDRLDGRSALITGASRGLGRVIARTLAGEGMELGLAARTAEDLEEIAGRVRDEGGRAEVFSVDLTDREALAGAADAVGEALGGVDVLVNNAGVTRVSPFHLREPAEVTAGVELNLTAPMLLARRLLPGMVERGRGHVVNVASLAGKAGPPYEAVYGATKAGLIGFTQSLRREYRGTGVSASAVCPGYVTGTGMYADVVEETGVRAPRAAGRAAPESVARAVVRAIRTDAPEILVNSLPVRPLTVLAEASPRLGAWLTRTLGLFRPYEEGGRRILEDGRGRPVGPG